MIVLDFLRFLIQFQIAIPLLLKFVRILLCEFCVLEDLGDFLDEEGGEREAGLGELLLFLEILLDDNGEVVGALGEAGGVVLVGAAVVLHYNYWFRY